MKLEILDFFYISSIFSFFLMDLYVDNVLTFNIFHLLHLGEKKSKNHLGIFPKYSLQLFPFLFCLFFVDFISLQDYFG